MFKGAHVRIKSDKSKQSLRNNQTLENTASEKDYN